MRTITLAVVCVALSFSLGNSVLWALDGLVLRRAVAPPQIDGQLDDACWQTAQRRPLQHYAGGELKVGGSVALSYDGQNLYASLWLVEPTPDQMKSASSADLWSGEVVEWFICPSEDGADYFQLAWNPGDGRFSARCSATGGATPQSDTSWQPKWQAAAVLGTNGWTAEAAISFAELGLKSPPDGVAWRINLNRQRAIGGTEWSALSPTGSDGFHAIQRINPVSFGKPVASDDSFARGKELRALIGCWGNRFGLAAIFEPHVQLDRALGPTNVAIRVCTTGDGGAVGSVIRWPLKYRDLAQYHLIVISDLPARSFSDQNLRDLRRYVEEGGVLIFMGALTGWLHKPEDAWFTSPLADVIPMRPTGKAAVRPLDVASVKDSPLFAGIPVEQLKLGARSAQAELTTNATLLASVGGSPFIAEKKAGQGRVIQIQGTYAHNATMVPVASFRTDLFLSPWYPVFWDNLIAYATGQPVPHPAVAPALPAPKETALVVDLIGDNLGDVFRPGGVVNLKPLVEGKVEYPYELVAVVADNWPVGSFPLAQAGAVAQITLPDLDRGAYKLRLELRKDAAVVDTLDVPFSVVLPVLAEDEFNFKALVEVAYQGETDARRIAAELKSIGFNGVFWLGGDIYAGYQGVYRLWNEGRAVARFQEAGLRVTPVFYQNLYYIAHPESAGATSGQTNSFTRLIQPDMGYPGKDYLPHARFWLDIFGEKIQGRTPLTDGYAAGDEIVGVWYPATERVRNGFATATGLTAPTNETGAAAYQFLNYRLKLAADFIWLARAVNDAYHPGWSMESVISPNSFGGHSSPLIDPFTTMSSLGATSPDEYWYGEPKFYVKNLSSLAISWSGTDFGRLARLDNTGGQLNRSYYDEFPEQVFSSLTAGIHQFQVFAYDCTNFEKNGRQDAKFAAIARQTTAEAGRIGRTLNHHQRSRARVAMLYPHTAHLWLAMGQVFNPDYLQMTGFSQQYLDLYHAKIAEFDLLRQLAGHVDFLFDDQIRRGDLDNYDVCVVAYARQIEAETLRRLRRFAERGGTLVVSSDSARFDENNQPADALWQALPATLGDERAVPTDYSLTRLRNREAWSRGHALVPRADAEVLIAHGDKQPAGVCGKLGRGEALVLGLPLAAFGAKEHAAQRDAFARFLDARARLISRPVDGEFTATTFRPHRGEGRVFMVFNGHKQPAATIIEACADEAEAKHTLADLVTGERVPFEIKDGQLTFPVACRARWGRAFALLPKAPAKIEVSTGGPVAAGQKWMIAVRLLGADDLVLRSTLPFDLTVTDPTGTIRDDLSGVRVAENGVYVFAMNWPVAAKPGQWRVTVTEKISGAADNAMWQSYR